MELSWRNQSAPGRKVSKLPGGKILPKKDMVGFPANPIFNEICTTTSCTLRYVLSGHHIQAVLASGILQEFRLKESWKTTKIDHSKKK